MDENELTYTIPELIKSVINKINSKDKKEYTIEKFITSACICWSKLNAEDKASLLKLIESEDFSKIIKELK